MIWILSYLDPLLEKTNTCLDPWYIHRKIHQFFHLLKYFSTCDKRQTPRVHVEQIAFNDLFFSSSLAQALHTSTIWLWTLCLNHSTYQTPILEKYTNWNPLWKQKIWLRILRWWPAQVISVFLLTRVTAEMVAKPQKHHWTALEVK